MRELRTEIEIHASAERVWDALTDFSSYPDWNPFVRRIIGEPAVGAQLETRVHTPRGRSMTFQPKVTKVDPPHEFRWLGHLLVQGLFDGEHVFEIEPLDGDRVRFVQRESFRGFLAPLLIRMVEDDTRRGFEQMNAALKARAEGTHQAGP